ncbi:hypothetical protein OV450_8272 [Actinobacteria bacterium OV450]|nr:hypothetical protein OV450_8272 [Actinobacteria bacterium OV450]
MRIPVPTVDLRIQVAVVESLLDRRQLRLLTARGSSFCGRLVGRSRGLRRPTRTAEDVVTHRGTVRSVRRTQNRGWGGVLQRKGCCTGRGSRRRFDGISCGLWCGGQWGGDHRCRGGRFLGQGRCGCCRFLNGFLGRRTHGLGRRDCRTGAEEGRIGDCLGVSEECSSLGSTIPLSPAPSHSREGPGRAGLVSLGVLSLGCVVLRHGPSPWRPSCSRPLPWRPSFQPPA